MDLAELSDRAWERGRLSLSARLRRLRSKLWALVQCAVAASVAWLIAEGILGHTTPFFAPIAAVVCLNSSYGQRHRRIAEVMVGVTIGIGIGDLFTHIFDRGWWQIAVVVAAAMAAAVLLDAGAVLMGQAAVQSIVVTTLLPIDGGLSRIEDALIGGGVALVAATVVPRATLRRPRELAANIVGELADLLRLARRSADDGDLDLASDTLDRARETERMLEDLRAAAGEGLDIARVTPFRRHSGQDARSIAEVVGPLDRSIRNTRVLIRRVVVAARLDETMPPDYLDLLERLALATDAIATELSDDRRPDAVQPRLREIGALTAGASSPLTLSAAVVLGQIRSLVVDLLELSGLSHASAVDLVPARA
ncbi:MAG: FUSC family protein [Nocardioidaceae bacterium]